MGIISIQLVCFFCLLVYLEFFIPFLTHLETSPLPVKGCKFWHMLCTYGLWAVRVFSVLHLLWHGASVDIGHLRGPVKLTPNAERLTVELSLPVLTRFLSQLEFEHRTFRLLGECSNPLWHHGRRLFYSLFN